MMKNKPIIFESVSITCNSDDKITINDNCDVEQDVIKAMGKTVSFTVNCNDLFIMPPKSWFKPEILN